jgi:hypothetical protein
MVKQFGCHPLIEPSRAELAQGFRCTTSPDGGGC